MTHGWTGRVTGPRPRAGTARRVGWRGAALLPLGALLVDRLRYLVSFGPGAERAFDPEGHGSLAVTLPVLVALVACAVGGLLVPLARAWRTGRCAEAVVSARALWLVTAGALLVIHLTQETIEGIWIGGNPGLAGLLGVGGLWAALAAAVIGGLIALALRGARALIRYAAARSRAGVRRPRATPRLAPLRSPRRRRPAPLARAAAGRAPPPIAAIAA